MRHAKTRARCTLAAFLLAAGATEAATPSDAVIAVFQFPDAAIAGISAGPGGEVALYDRTPGANGGLIRFLQATHPQGGELTVEEAPETVTLYGEAPNLKGWMVRDGGLLFALSANTKTTAWGVSSWQQMWLYIIAGRAKLKAINYNGADPVQGDEPWTAPLDYRYAVNGFTIKPAWSEDYNNPILIVDDTVKGNLDLLELDAVGLGLQHQVRYSYRDRLEDGCEWPDIDPGPWYTCRWMGLAGNGLALEWRFDTRKNSAGPNLHIEDEVYLLDPLRSKSQVRRIRISESLEWFTARELTPIDLSVYDGMLANGAESLYTAPRLDELWAATGIQSFQNGFVAAVDTFRLTGTVIDPVLRDQNLLLPDYADPGHWFVPVADGFNAPSPLILREIRNGAVVNSVTALTDYAYGALDAAAFDPRYGLAYLAIDDTVYVVSVTAPDGTDLDGDGLPNDYETAHGLDPEDPTDARQDIDGDSWTYVDEYLAGTDPMNPDSDGDGVSDATDPLPMHPDACGDFIIDGVLAALDIAGDFRCNFADHLQIQGRVRVLPGGLLDLEAWSIRAGPGFSAEAGAQVRMR